MRRPTWWLLLVLVLGWRPDAFAGGPRTASELSAAIDARLSAGWSKAGVRPAALVDDAAFLRRASLDLIGRIPTAAEARVFLSDPSPSAVKRAKRVNRLVDSGGYTRHMATFWRRTWLPQADTPEFARLADDFEAWAGLRVREDAPYDQVVRELISFDSGAAGRPAAVSPGGFFVASEHKPENLAANATRALLGVNLECAQCHNHPFARWTRDQFWRTAAFFATPKPAGGGKLGPPRLTIPNTEKSLAPQWLDGAPVPWPDTIAPDTGRRLLANWMTARDNPFFARNAVNRLWAQLFGTALVEPLDDLSGDSGNTGDRAVLLEDLADAFVASGYDLKFMTRAFALTETYQRSVDGDDGGLTDRQLFARMPVRGLTGEQLYDSLRTAAGLPPERDDVGLGQGRDARKRFAAQFYVARPIAAERSVTQALSIMNGRFMIELIDPSNNRTLAGILDAPFLDARARVETLFLAALGRLPDEREVRPLIGHVAGSGERSARAFGDVFWVLVNTTEFNTNH